MCVCAAAVSRSCPAAAAFKQQNVTEAGAVAAASASLATFGCSLRFGLVLLAVSYSSCKLRQFKEARAVQDFSTVSTPMVVQQQQQQQQPRDWLEVSVAGEWFWAESGTVFLGASLQHRCTMWGFWG